MKTKSKFIVVFSCFLVAILSASFLTMKKDTSLLISKAENDYSITLSTYNGNSSQTYQTKNGNNLVFKFTNCHTVGSGFLLTENGASIRNNNDNSKITGIKSLLVTAEEKKYEINLEYNIFLDGVVQKTDTSHKPNEKLDVKVENNGFAVTFREALTITSLVIEYSCA